MFVVFLLATVAFAICILSVVYIGNKVLIAMENDREKNKIKNNQNQNEKEKEE